MVIRRLQLPPPVGPVFVPGGVVAAAVETGGWAWAPDWRYVAVDEEDVGHRACVMPESRSEGGVVKTNDAGTRIAVVKNLRRRVYELVIPSPVDVIIIGRVVVVGGIDAIIRNAPG